MKQVTSGCKVANTMWYVSQLLPVSDLPVMINLVSIFLISMLMLLSSGCPLSHGAAIRLYTSLPVTFYHPITPPVRSSFILIT